MLLLFFLLLLLLMMAGTDVQFGGVPTEHQLHCTLILLLLDFPDTLLTVQPENQFSREDPRRLSHFPPGNKTTNGD